VTFGPGASNTRGWFSAWTATEKDDLAFSPSARTSSVPGIARVAEISNTALPAESVFLDDSLTVPASKVAATSTPGSAAPAPSTAFTSYPTFEAPSTSDDCPETSRRVLTHSSASWPVALPAIATMLIVRFALPLAPPPAWSVKVARPEASVRLGTAAGASVTPVSVVVAVTDWLRTTLLAESLTSTDTVAITEPSEPGSVFLSVSTITWLIEPPALEAPPPAPAPAPPQPAAETAAPSTPAHASFASQPLQSSRSNMKTVP
jgi:hypothetical protein